MLDNGNLKPLATALNMSGLNPNTAANNNNAAATANIPQMPTVKTPPVRQPSQPNNSEALPMEKNAGRSSDRNETSTPKRKDGAR